MRADLLLIRVWLDNPDEREWCCAIMLMTLRLSPGFDDDDKALDLLLQWLLVLFMLLWWVLKKAPKLYKYK